MPRRRYICKHRNSPFWQYDFVVKGDRFRGSTETTEERAAQRIADEKRAIAIADAAAGRSPERRSPMTLAVAFSRFMAEVGDFLRERYNLDNRLRILEAGLGAQLRLHELTPSLIAAYIGRRRATVKPATVNREIETLRRIWRRADRVWKPRLGEEPPWGQLLQPEPAQRQWTLSTEAVERFVAALPADFRPVVPFVLLTAARLSNVIGLRWADIDSREIVLRDVKSTRAGKLHRLPLTDELRYLLASLNGQHPEFVFTYVCQRSSKTHVKGERYPFSRDGWRRAWARAVKAAGLKSLRFHDLRHGAVTLFVMITRNIRLAQRWAGHASITTTMRYAAVADDDLRRGMEAMSRNVPGIETARVAPLAVSAGTTTTYEVSDDAGPPVPKAGALPG